MVKKLSCVSHGSLKRFPPTFTIGTHFDHGGFVILEDLPTPMTLNKYH